MGNTHSQHKKFRHHKYHDTNKLSSPSNNTITSNRPMMTPPISTKSTPVSRSNSRPPSMIGCVHKILVGKSSSTLDVTEDNNSSISIHAKVPPRRSFSAPADLFPEKIGNDETTTINGRIYQTLNNKYCLPIDEEEQDRLTNTHYVLKHCFGDNFSAPVHDLLSRSVSVARDSIMPTNSQQCMTMMMMTMETISVSPSAVSSSSSSSIKTNWTKQGTPARVLDVACGSGVWVLEMATAFPNSQFYGIDFACIYPNTIKPPNTNFHQADILDPAGFPYPDEYFDYIHMRLVCNCFSSSDLKFVLSEINRVLKPGGYVEFRDIDPTIKNPGPITEKFFSDFTSRMSQLHSVDVSWTQHMCEVISSQGDLTDIHHQVVSIGFGYQGPLASSIDCSIRDALRSYKQFFMEAYDISSEVCEENINKIIEESAEHHSFFNYYMAWARKPLVLEQLMNSGQESPLVPLTPIATEAVDMISSTLAVAVAVAATTTAPCESAQAELIASENAFDIVHFANGFTE